MIQKMQKSYPFFNWCLIPLSVNFMQVIAYILLVKAMRFFKITEIKKVILLSVFSVSACILILIFPDETSAGAKDGLEFCAGVLVPSLFPFMVISSFTIESGLCSLLEKPFSKIIRCLFNLPGICTSTIIMSLVGGYPVGARGIRSLYEKGLITEKQAQQMAYFCVCSGPGFLITFVGASLYRNKNIGFILLFASVISVLILGISIGLFNRNKRKINTENTTYLKPKLADFSQSLAKSASDASRGVIEMCALVVFFNVFIEFGEMVIKNQNALKAFYILNEVTTASSNLSVNTPIYIIAFALGFGGLCVHFQVFQGLKDIKINKLLFFIFRIIQGILTSLFTNIILCFFPVSEEVFSTTQKTNAVISSSSYLGSIMLVITAVCFIYSIKSNNNKKLGG